MSIFNCQQFSVQQNHAAMKICTDSLLFAAMAEIKEVKQVLDIGTGNGILALMLAQLGANNITGVEIHPEAYREAAKNFNNSPWATYLQVVNESIQDFAQSSKSRYDFIISNPPFFEQHYKTTATAKRLARHSDSLPHAELIAAVVQLLTTDGRFYVLLPTQAVVKFSYLAELAGLYVFKRVDLQAHVHKPAKVAALSFSRQKTTYQYQVFTVYSKPGEYSRAYCDCLRPFLLRFADN
jgi:tRNA1Val (adenine37-N6)-methyltransferase